MHSYKHHNTQYSSHTCSLPKNNNNLSYYSDSQCELISKLQNLIEHKKVRSTTSVFDRKLTKYNELRGLQKYHARQYSARGSWRSDPCKSGNKFLSFQIPNHSFIHVYFSKQNQISERLAARVLREFDRSINNALATRVKTRYTFKGHLSTYRFCDNVWTLLFKDIDFRETQNEKICATNVKFVACDGKSLSKFIYRLV